MSARDRWWPFRLELTVVIAALAFTFLWRLEGLLANPPLWGDEAMVAVNIVGRSFAGLSDPLKFHQLAPPGFLYLLEATSRVVGFSEIALRGWAFLAGCGAMVVFAIFALRHLPRLASVTAVVLMCVSRYPLRHSLEVKPYSIDLLAGALLLLLAAEVRRHRLLHGTLGWPLLAWTACGAIFTWVSFPTLLLLAATGLWMAADAWPMLRRGKGWLPLGTAAVVLGISAAGMLAIYLDVRSAEIDLYQDMSMWSGAFPPWSQPWIMPWWLLDVHAGRLMSYPWGDKNFASTLPLIACVVGAVTLWRMGPRWRSLWWLLISPAIVGLVAASLHLYPYGTTARTMLYMGPGVVSFIGIGLVAIADRAARPGRAQVIVWIVLAVIGVGMFIGTSLKPYKHTVDLYTREEVLRLAATATAADLWLIPHAEQLHLAGHQEWIARAAHDGAVLQFYVETRSPARLMYAEPVPDVLAAARSARQVLMIVHDNVPSDPPMDETAGPYIAALTAELGPPTVERRFLGKTSTLVMMTWPGGLD